MLATKGGSWLPKKEDSCQRMNIKEGSWLPIMEGNYQMRKLPTEMEVSYQCGSYLPKWKLNTIIEVSYQYGIGLPKVEVSHQILKFTTIKDVSYQRRKLATKKGRFLPKNKYQIRKLATNYGG